MGTAVFIIVTAVTLGVMLLLLELNKNTLLGFILTLALAGAYAAAHFTVFKDGSVMPPFAAWLLWVLLFAAVMFLTWPPSKQRKTVKSKNPVKTEVVELPCGKVRGVYSDDGEVEIFAGIPFAKPPVGDLRWREPQPPEPWQGVLEADTYAPMGMQPVYTPILDSLRQIFGFHDYRITLEDNCRPAMSEDSLYLNVFRPKGGAKDLPVIVYIHGGSLKSGQSWYPDCCGEGLAHEGMVVVTITYRLGAFGFLALEQLAEESPNGTTGNYGLLDVIASLEWIRDNIAYFGGDPGNVTVSGESSGAACAGALCTSPMAKGLFRRVMLESTTVASLKPPHSFRTMEEALASGRALMKKYGCINVEQLRSVPAEKLVADSKTEHHVTVDGYALPELPYLAYKKGKYNEEAIIHGCNSEESGPFVVFDRANKRNYEKKVRRAFGELADKVLELYPGGTNKQAAENWAFLWSAVYFYYPHYCLDRLAAENGIPAYQYRFTKKNGRLGAWHSGEEVYFYGNIPEKTRLFDDGDRKLSKTMTRYFVNFAAKGDPNGEGLPAWERSAGSGEMLELGENVRMINDARMELFKLFDEKYGWGKTE